MTIKGFKIFLRNLFFADRSNKMFRAAYYYKDKDYQKATEIYLEIISGSPNNYDAHLWLASTYLALEKFDDATVYFKKTLTIDPNRFEGLYNYFMLLGKLNQYEQAKDISRKILSFPSLTKFQYADVYYKKGLIEFNNGLFQDTIDSMLKSLEYVPDNKSANNLMMAAYERQKKSDAKKIRQEFDQDFNN